MTRHHIPAGWLKRSLDEVATVQTGLSKSSTRKIEDLVELPYLRVANVQDGHIDLSEVKTVAISRKMVDRFLLRQGDVLLTEGGDFDKLGRGHIWDGQIERCLHQNHVFAVRVDSRQLDSKFFAAQTQSSYGRNYFLSCAKQTTNLASINSTQLRQFPVILPPLAEQRGIAAVLGTWDRAIEQTEKLIAAKERRKKGLMQQLLTGRTRFPQFAPPSSAPAARGPWLMVRLKDVFRRITRTVDSGNTVEPLSITATVGFVSQREKFSKVIAGEQLGRYILLRRGEFAYNKGNSKSYPQGCIYPLTEYDEAAVPHVYFCFAANSPDIDPEFYSHYFSHGMLNRQLARIINSGVRNDGLLNLPAEHFFRTKIAVPPLAEQRAIAAVLTAADRELTHLRTHLAALQQQKKGLMQQLLTGQVRIPRPEACHNA